VWPSFQSYSRMGHAPKRKPLWATGARFLQAKHFLLPNQQHQSSEATASYQKQQNADTI